VGLAVGESVGLAGGESVVLAVGESVGLAVGESVGLAVGESVGASVGAEVRSLMNPLDVLSCIVLGNGTSISSAQVPLFNPAAQRASPVKLTSDVALLFLWNPLTTGSTKKRDAESSTSSVSISQSAPQLEGGALVVVEPEEPATIVALNVIPVPHPKMLKLCNLTSITASSSSSWREFDSSQALLPVGHVAREFVHEHSFASFLQKPSLGDSQPWQIPSVVS
jgi:hypothetical protein